MSEETKTFEVQSAALSDRGLNERRPLNEDAFLHDPERSIFAVADGVGGAEAGEVAITRFSTGADFRFADRGIPLPLTVV